MSIITHHLAIKAAVQRIESALDRETDARNRAKVPSDKDAIESAMIARRSAYYDLKAAVDALIDGGM
jgi:hypothetical protein